MRSLTRRIEDDASTSPCQGEAINRSASSDLCVIFCVILSGVCGVEGPRCPPRPARIELEGSLSFMLTFLCHPERSEGSRAPARNSLSLSGRRRRIVFDASGEGPNSKFQAPLTEYVRDAK